MAEPLPRPLDVDADELPLADELARPPHGLAIALAAAHAEDT
jgi:hypothetical protein